MNRDFVRVVRTQRIIGAPERETLAIKNVSRETPKKIDEKIDFDVIFATHHAKNAPKDTVNDFARFTAKIQEEVETELQMNEIKNLHRGIILQNAAKLNLNN